MAFSVVPGLTAADIQVQLPAQGDTDWAINLRDLAFKLLAQHDHTGSGNGRNIVTNAIADNAVTSAKILLTNNVSLNSLNSSATEVPILKLAADDKIEIEQDIDVLNMSNNTFITSTDQVGTGNVDIVKVNGGDRLEFGAEIAAAKMKQNTNFTGRNAANDGDVNIAKVDAQDRVLLQDTLYVKGTATLADNTSVAAAVPNLPTVSTDETIFMFFKIVRNGDVRFGQIIFDEDGTNLVEEITGDDVGVTFTNDAGTLDYTTTSTGFAGTLTYTIIKV
jgi:hypothetical protein